MEQAQQRKRSLSNVLPRRQSINKLILQKRNSLLRRRSSNDAPPPVLDNRIEELQSTLKLKRKDLMKCWNVFRQYDSKKRGFFTLAEFMNYVAVGEPLTLFIETIFELSDVIDFDHIEYGPLFYTIATYCMFEVRSENVVNTILVVCQNINIVHPIWANFNNESLRRW